MIKKKISILLAAVILTATTASNFTYAATISTENTSVIYTANTATVSKAEEFIAAINDSSVTAIELTSNISLIDENEHLLRVLNNNVSINGNGYTITVPSVDKDNDSQVLSLEGNNITLKNVTIDVLSVEGASFANALTVSGDNVTLSNVTVNNSKRAGINVYKANNVTIDGVTINNSATTGLSVNGSKVNVNSLTLKGNKNVGIEVSYGSGVTNAAELNVNGYLNIQGSIFQVKTEDKTGCPTIVVNADGFLKKDIALGKITTYSAIAAPEVALAIINPEYTIVNEGTSGKDAISLRFTLTKDVNLDEYKISVASTTKEKYTGIWWKNFLVNAQTGVKYGLSGIIPAGTYINDFTLDQFNSDFSTEDFTFKLVEKATNEVISEASLTAEHPFAKPAVGEGDSITPELDPVFPVVTEGAVGVVKTYTNNNGQTFINFEITEAIDRLGFEDIIEIRWFDIDGKELKKSLSYYANFLTPVTADDITGANPTGEKLGFGEFIPAGHYSISYNNPLAVSAEIKVINTTLPTGEGLGPNGDVTPEVDSPADEGFGPEGDVMPEITPEDSPSFDPEEDNEKLPETGGSSEDKPSFDVDQDGDNLPNTGGTAAASILGFGALISAAGAVLLRKKRD